MLKLIGKSEKAALVGKNINLTYNRLLEQIDHYAELLHNISKERVVIFSENRPEWIVALYAVWKTGSIVVPIDALSAQEDIVVILRDSNPRAVFCSEEKHDAMLQALKEAGQMPDVHVFDHIADDQSLHDPEDFNIHDPEQTAVILYTSGTTGNPKGVMLSFQNIHTNIIAVSHDVVIYTPEDRVMILLPFHHVLPLVGTIIAPLCVGATMVLNTSLAAEDLIAIGLQMKRLLLGGGPDLISFGRFRRGADRLRPDGRPPGPGHGPRAWRRSRLRRPSS